MATGLLGWVGLGRWVSEIEMKPTTAQLDHISPPLLPSSWARYVLAFDVTKAHPPFTYMDAHTAHRLLAVNQGHNHRIPLDGQRPPNLQLFEESVGPDFGPAVVHLPGRLRVVVVLLLMWMDGWKG